MAGVLQTLVVLLTICLIPCFSLPRRNYWGERFVDECPFISHRDLYSEVSDTATTVLHPDYMFLFNFLFLQLKNETTGVRFSNIKANLEISPISIFGNLSLFRCRHDDYCEDGYGITYNIEPNLGEFITEKIFEAYSHYVNSSFRKVPTDLNQMEPFIYDKTKWTSPWLKRNLVSALVYIANSLEGLVEKKLTDEGKSLLQSNNIEKILQVIGELSNNAIHSTFNLNIVNELKRDIWHEFENLHRKLIENNINTAVDCWYSTDGFYHSGQGSEEKNLLLQGMIEVVPKEELKNVFRSWSEYNTNDIKANIDKILVVVDQKIQEIDMARMINLFKQHTEDLIEDMKSENVAGRNLFQRVEKVNHMMEKAMWRIQSGLWPEMINLMDRLVLSLKNVNKNRNGKFEFWNKLDILLSPTYHELRRQYEAALIKELFPTSKKQLGEPHLWNHPFVRHLHGKLNPVLHNLFANPQYNVLPKVLDYVKKMNVVEWEKWLEDQIYWNIKNSIRSDFLRGGNTEDAHWPLKWTLAELDRAGFADLFIEDWENIPRDLKIFLDMDIEAYFLYFLHAFLTTY